MRRRTVRLLIVVAAGFLLGLAAVVALVLITAPQPREAPGWSLMAPIPDPRGETATVVAGGHIHVMGGLAGPTGSAVDTVSVYDPDADAWAAGPSLPAPRHHAAAAAIGSTIYLAGGADAAGAAQPNLWQIEAGTDDWTEAAPMPEGRYGHRLIGLDGRLYVVGGTGGTAAILVYDPATDAWETRASLPVGRDHLSAVAVGREIWVIGGRNADGIHDRVDIYDTAADAWRDGPALPTPTSGGAEALADGIILVSGGEEVGVTGGRIIDRHWWLDTGAAEPEWRELPPPPLAVHGVPGVVVDGRYHVIGGASRAGSQSVLAWSEANQAFDLAELRP